MDELGIAQPEEAVKPLVDRVVQSRDDRCVDRVGQRLLPRSQRVLCEYLDLCHGVLLKKKSRLGRKENAPPKAARIRFKNEDRKPCRLFICGTAPSDGDRAILYHGTRLRWRSRRGKTASQRS
jgi:hypothetical protein